VIGAIHFAAEQQLGELTVTHSACDLRVREFAAAGGLISYGTSLGEGIAKWAHTGHILKGEKVSICRCSRRRKSR
jgi:hypothetical protein